MDQRLETDYVESLIGLLAALKAKTGLKRGGVKSTSIYILHIRIYIKLATTYYVPNEVSKTIKM